MQPNRHEQNLVSQSADRRRGERRPIESDTLLRTSASGIGFKVEVSDLSPFGCGLESAFKLTVGEEVELGLDGAGSVRGWVTSCRGTKYGMEFDKPLDNSAMMDAFTGAKIITLHPLNPRAFPEPDIAGFPRPVKLAILVIATFASWSALLFVTKVVM